MQPISLVSAASYLPENIVPNSFFTESTTDGEKAPSSNHPMFKGTEFRHHVAEGETAISMLEQASLKLGDQLNLDFSKDVDIILINTTVLDMPFTGCGAELAHTLGAKPSWIIDVHNGGCVSFVYMMDIARSLMASSGAKTAMICNVQNAAGRIFGHPENRKLPQSAVPGDGCGVGYLVANDSSPVQSIIRRSYGEYAKDMKAVSDDGQKWWDPRETPMHIEFTEHKLASIVGRGNKIVPEALYAALKEANISMQDVDKLITNQPNHTFLRNWRESVCVEEKNHIHTFPEHGNLFGAALPISLARVIETGTLKKGDNLLLGGFAHAGDYACGSVVHWQGGA
jgi:3-oxoacyl-[acyl-carrier-protein] synthase-3